MIKSGNITLIVVVIKYLCCFFFYFLFFSIYRFAENCHRNQDGKGSTHALQIPDAELLRGRETLQTGERLYGVLWSVIYSLECWLRCLCVSQFTGIAWQNIFLQVMIWFNFYLLSWDLGLSEDQMANGVVSVKNSVKVWIRWLWVGFHRRFKWIKIAL